MNSLVKKAALASALSLALPGTAMAELLITEYVEGSSNNKVIEITNMGSSDIDMGDGGYVVALYTNGSDTESDRKAELTGVLAAGSSYMIYNDGGDAEFQFPDNGIASSATWFNGDDAIVLRKGDTIIDSIGKIGEDPGSAWTDGDNWSTQNMTLRRKASVSGGDANTADDFPGSDNQWVALEINTYDGLGCSGETACGAGGGDGDGDGGGSTVDNSIIITEYVEGSGNNKVIEITNIGSADVDMGTDSYRIALYTNGSDTETDGRGLDLTGVLAAGASYMVYNDGGDPEFQFPDNGAASSATWFNGDDAIVLTKGGTVVDSLGKVGEDPGSAWTDGDSWSTQNMTLRRKDSVTAGDAVTNDDFPGANNQWSAFEINTFDGLGCSGEAACNSDGGDGDGDGGGSTTTNTILITEYIEGSSNNKVLELTNIGSEDVDMGAGKYKLAMFSNGSDTEHDERKIELTGVLAAGKSYIVYNDGGDPEFQFPEMGEASSVTWFNGDDALVLTRDGEVVDSFGKVGEDPGSAWTDANNADWSTQNKTLRRLSSVTTGDTAVSDDFPGSPNQWAVFDINTVDGIGCAGEDACSTGGGDGGGEPTGENIMITEYIEGSGNNKAIEISNMGSESVDMGANQYKVVMYSNGDTTAHEERFYEFEDLVLEPGKSFIIYNESADPELIFPAGEGAASTVTFYNGNDTLVLTRMGVAVDSFGRVGEDPGSDGWLDANNPEFSSREKTLRRKTTVTAGDTALDDAFPGDVNQWSVFGTNVSDGLGCPGEDPCAGGGGGEPNEPIENYVLITEYIEGSASNKAIELTNIGQTDIDLLTEGYRLEAYNNGNTSVSNALNLFGKLVPGSSIVVYNRDADEQFKRAEPEGIASNVTFFNGDDAIVLRKNGVVVDSLGQIGFRPSNGWTDPSNENFHTQNKTLRRKASITVGDHIANDSFPGTENQWEAFDIDTADGVGCGGEVTCTGAEPKPVAGIGGGVTFGECVNCPEISKVSVVSNYVESEYYAQALAADEAGFAAALNADISAKHVPLTYSQVWSVLTFSDQDPDNAANVIELYTGNSIAKNMNGSGSNANDPDSWNREHVWSKSHGFNDDFRTAYTDAHHLRPADWSMNTTRSNLDFDNGGEPIEESPENYKDSDSFEPRSDVKGDVARMMFYMAARYNGAAVDATPDLVLVDYTGTASGSAEFGKLCSLWEWHHADPVDARETNRNNVIFEYQGNRNPFIDRPEWVDDIWADSCRPSTIPVININGPFIVAEGAQVSIDASGSSDEDGDDLSYHWRQLTDAFIHFDHDQSVLTFTAPKVEGDTPVEFELTVTDGENTVTQKFQLVIEDKTESGGVAGGSMNFLLLLLLPIVGLRRRFK